MLLGRDQVELLTAEDQQVRGVRSRLQVPADQLPGALLELVGVVDHDHRHDPGDRSSPAWPAASAADHAEACRRASSAGTQATRASAAHLALGPRSRSGGLAGPRRRDDHADRATAYAGQEGIDRRAGAPAPVGAGAPGPGRGCRAAGAGRARPASSRAALTMALPASS